MKWRLAFPGLAATTFLFGLVFAHLCSAQTPTLEFDFVSASDRLPSLQVIRSSIATYIDANRKMRLVPQNTARLDHDPTTGESLGLLVEEARTNKIRFNNYNPTSSDLTQFKIESKQYVPGGPIVPGTLQIVSDPDALEAAGLDGICTSGKVYLMDNLDAEYSRLVVTFKRAVSDTNTNPHSFSFYARVIGDGGPTLPKASAQLASSASLGISMTSASYRRYTAENVRPALATSEFRLVAYPRTRIYFILAQIEEAPSASSVILTEGSDQLAVRAGELVKARDLNINPRASTVFAEFVSSRKLEGDSTRTMVAVGLDKSGADVTRQYLYLGSGYVRAANYNSAGIKTSIHGARAVSDSLYRVAYSVAPLGSSLEGRIAVNGVLSRTTFGIDFPQQIDVISFGSTPGGSNAINSHIRKVAVYAQTLSDSSMRSMTAITRTNILFIGQSLAARQFTYQGDAPVLGSEWMSTKLKELMNVAVAHVVNGATGGSAADCRSARASSDSDNWTNCWWDPERRQIGTQDPRYGPALQLALDQITAFQATGQKFDYMIWVQGEADGSKIGTYITRDDYRVALEQIFNLLRTQNAHGQVPILIQGIGRRANASNGVQTVREVQFEMARQRPKVHMGAFVFDQQLVDRVHLTGMGSWVAADRLSYSIASLSRIDEKPNLGPRLSSVTLDLAQTTFSVAIEHGSAGVGLQEIANCGAVDLDNPSLDRHCGFVVFQGNTSQRIQSVRRLSDQMIRVELVAPLTAPSPDTPVKLGYAYGAMLELINDYPQLVHDTSARALPLQPGFFIRNASGLFDSQLNH